MENAYPKMLYKNGGDLEVDHIAVSTLTVDDAEAEKAAAAEGWTDLHTAQHGKKTK